jgi:hypothetical protein
MPHAAAQECRTRLLSNAARGCSGMPHAAAQECRTRR